MTDLHEIATAARAEDPILQLYDLSRELSGFGGWFECFLRPRLPARIDTLTVGELRTLVRNAEAEYRTRDSNLPGDRL